MSWSKEEGPDSIHSLSSLKTALQAIKCVPNLKPASESKAPGQSGLLHRKTGVCLSPLSVQCPGYGSLPRTVSPIATAPQDAGVQAPALATRARRSRGIPWVAATKTRAADVKISIPDVCKAPLQETLVLWNVTDEEHKDSAHPLWSLERITVSH